MERSGEEGGLEDGCKSSERGGLWINERRRGKFGVRGAAMICTRAAQESQREAGR